MTWTGYVGWYSYVKMRDVQFLVLRDSHGLGLHDCGVKKFRTQDSAPKPGCLLQDLWCGCIKRRIHRKYQEVFKKNKKNVILFYYKVIGWHAYFAIFCYGTGSHTQDRPENVGTKSGNMAVPSPCPKFAGKRRLCCLWIFSLKFCIDNAWFYLIVFTHVPTDFSSTGRALHASCSKCCVCVWVLTSLAQIVTAVHSVHEPTNEPWSHTEN